MPFREVGSIRYYTFDSFDQAGLIHAVVTRQGGTSAHPWDSLNVGSLAGDEPDRVNENRQRALQAASRDASSVYDVWQVHSANVVCTTAPRPPGLPHIKADAILTDRPEVTLFMRFADCVPIVLFDPVRNVTGLVHAGWQGTVRRVVQAAVGAFQNGYGSSPQDILAGIGPSIGVHHYPVGPEVVHQVQMTFGHEAASLLPDGRGAVQFDLWKANQLILEQCGLTRIEVAGICTACHLEDWFSHRAEHGKTGRFGVLAALPQD